MIVVDASVMVKCYQLEQDSDRAVMLIKEAGRIFAPELIRVEVASAFCRRVRMGEMNEVDAIFRCDKWQRHLETDSIQLVDNGELISDAVKLSIDLKHAIQDCLYLALARRERASLITADNVFTKKARSEYPEIQLLSEFEG